MSEISEVGRMTVRDIASSVSAGRHIYVTGSFQVFEVQYNYAMGRADLRELLVNGDGAMYYLPQGEVIRVGERLRLKTFKRVSAPKGTVEHIICSQKMLTVQEVREHLDMRGRHGR